MSRGKGLWRAVVVGGVVGVSVGVGIGLIRPIEPTPEPDVKQAIAEYEQRRALEYTTNEEAAWFGTTGLDEETERELPRYLRREFGEFLDDPSGLKASDLEYIGVFREADMKIHYWRVPYGDKEVFAYVEVDLSGTKGMNWGGRSPPKPAANAP